MQKWEYRTIILNSELCRHGHETYRDYVVVLADGTRLEGLEMVMRRYLDDGGWELVSMVPTGFSSVGTQAFIADTLTAIFRRSFIL